MRKPLSFATIVLCGLLCSTGVMAAKTAPQGIESLIQVGVRPAYLIQDMDEGKLKLTLESCKNGPFYRTDFSIGHRGAAMQFPEHTKESYEAAAAMGAGIIECDVTFTKDRELVCRHSQCDLHTTTNILTIPKLAAKCSEPFSPAEFDPKTGTLIKPASAQCCTSDITLKEFKQLKGKMEASNPEATTVAQYLDSTPSWRTDLYTAHGTLMTHAESIELFTKLGVKMIPELKAPSVTMPFDGDYNQEKYAQAMIDDYKKAGVAPENVFPQSFDLQDILYWLRHEPTFGKQGVYLDGRYDEATFDAAQPETWSPTMEELFAQNIRIIAPPMWILLTLNSQGDIVPSEYAKRAKAAGLEIITWTLERSGLLNLGGGWYYTTIKEAINNDGDMLVALDVLAQQVGILGIFSDWPATVTYYANCKGL
ncbi:MAG: glycerophosphodiester phosphodiesterase [Desulfotalea sp.]|nr:MAG: glycerophosphodiester phosphodiesterase [Desulfotalea sp.]